MHTIPSVTGMPNSNNPADPLNDVLTAVWPLDLQLQRLIYAEIPLDEDSTFDTWIIPEDQLPEAISVDEMPGWLVTENSLPAFLTSVTPAHAQGRLASLCQQFNLTELEYHILLLLLLPALDNRYEQIFSSLRINNLLPKPSYKLMQALFSQTYHDRLTLRQRLLPAATLLRHHLVTSKDIADNTVYTLDQRIFHFLTGHDDLPDPLPNFAQWCSEDALPVSAGYDELPCVPALRNILTQNADHTLQITLKGTDGSGRGNAIQSATTQTRQPVLTVDLRLLPDDSAEFRSAVILLVREALLFNGVLIFRQAEKLSATEPEKTAILAQELKKLNAPFFFLVPASASPVWLPGIAHLQLSTGDMTAQREKALLLTLSNRMSDKLPASVTSVLSHFPVHADQCGEIAYETSLYHKLFSPDTDDISSSLRHALTLRSEQDFGNLVQRLSPRRTLEDLIVSDTLRGQLKEILASLRQRNALLDPEFKRKIHYGTGISALFYGSSGTGKTMAAEAIAHEIGADLMKVDLSVVVNKFIGETEKNLSRIFDAGEKDSGVLFFDEADALFGKRSEVKDAHDRHANIEVSYLLQRLENYPGLVILASNHRGHLDNAFTRRLTFMTEFETPDSNLRELMWRNAWAASVSFAPDVDFRQLAEKNFTGANIRNIAMLASWLAMESNDGEVQSVHIQTAVQREMNKLGRLV